jgi:uncharacterized protein
MTNPRHYKLIFTGPMGAGKTTAIGAISEIEPVTTDEHNSDVATHPKALTTTALDYGEVKLEGGEKLLLFGTPGQSRFDHMWNILGQGALGVVILLDNTSADPLADLGMYVEAFYELVVSGRAVVGVGRTDVSAVPLIDDFHELLRAADIVLPILSVDVRKRKDVLLLLHVLFNQIEVREPPNPTIE